MCVCDSFLRSTDTVGSLFNVIGDGSVSAAYNEDIIEPRQRCIPFSLIYVLLKALVCSTRSFSFERVFDLERLPTH